VRERVHGRRSAEAGEKKYDESAASMIACSATGADFPGIVWKNWKTAWNPTSGGDAMPDHEETAVPLQPALEELKRQAAQGEVVHNDDTSMRVLSLDRDADISPERTGVFTSGWYGPANSAASRCISPGASTPARIWPRC